MAHFEGGLVNLGKDIEAESVQVKDIHKNAYKITFNLGNHPIAGINSQLVYQIYGVNYTSCTVADDSQFLAPTFKLIKEFNLGD